MSPAYPLHTDRLVLRPLREEDIDTVLTYRNDPEVSALQDWDLPVTREHVERQVREHSDWDDIDEARRKSPGLLIDFPHPGGGVSVVVGGFRW